jgi:hypothetical protein
VDRVGWDNIVYVFSRDGERIKMFFDGINPFWDEKGKNLAFTHLGKIEENNSIYVVKVRNWSLSEVDLPSDNAMLENWVHK